MWHKIFFIEFFKVYEKESDIQIGIFFSNQITSINRFNGFCNPSQQLCNIFADAFSESRKKFLQILMRLTCDNSLKNMIDMGCTFV